MLNRLQGKVIIVAGAGGIGDELARRYASEGASVLLGDVEGDRAKAVAERISGDGGKAIGIALDGADDAAVRYAVALAVSSFGGLDGFHANFSAFSEGDSTGDVLEVPLDAFDHMMHVNARGFMLCTRHALPAMLARGGGSMVYTSSGAAYMGEVVRLGYAMSKSAIHALMRHVARRFGPEGIRANVIAPGVIAHERFAGMVPADVAEEFKSVTAIKTRLGTSEDIAAMGALLMADEGSFITGQVIGVDGGTIMRA